MSTPKWNLVVDLDRCNNCHNCTLAVRDEHVGNDFPGYAAPQPRHGHHWIGMRRAEHGQPPIVDVVNLPVTCNHCDAAPCVTAGRGAVRKRPDGIVIIDPVTARGRRDLVDACPYGAVWWNEELQLPQAWIFDAHLLDQGWTEPRCAQACPTGAMRAERLTDEAMQALATEQRLSVLHPEWGTRPRVYYRNLQRFERWTLAGTVLVRQDGTEDNLAGAQVRLWSDGAQPLAQAQTDDYGEFRLAGLPPQAARYRLDISCTGHRTLSLPVEMQASLTLPPQVLPRDG